MNTPDYYRGYDTGSKDICRFLQRVVDGEGHDGVFKRLVTARVMQAIAENFSGVMACERDLQNDPVERRKLIRLVK